MQVDVNTPQLSSMINIDNNFTITDNDEVKEEIYQQIVHYLDSLKNGSTSSYDQLKLFNLVLSNIDYLLYDWQDITDDLVQIWMDGKPNSSLNFIIWLISVYSFLSHEYPIHTQIGLLKWIVGLRSNGNVKMFEDKVYIQKLEILFKHQSSLSIMINYCLENLFVSGYEPFWLKNLSTNISLQTKLNLSFLNLFNFSKQLLDSSDFTIVVNHLLKFGQYDLAIDFLERKISTIDSQYALDIGYCHLWLCGIIFDKYRNNVIDLHRIPLNELAFFIREIINVDNGLLQNTQSSGKIVEISKNLFHLFEDASLSQQFFLSGQWVTIEHVEMIADRLILALTQFHNGGHFRMALNIYQRLVEYYNHLPNSESILDHLNKQYSIWCIDRKEGIEYLSKHCRYYYVSVMISSERREEYIYRAYHFENIDSLIEKRIKVDFPNCAIINARNVQISESSIRIVPAFEEKPNCFIVYDYQREDDWVFLEDDKIFGCSKIRCFTGDVDIFTNSLEQQYSLMIWRARIINSISVFDETNQMHANFSYLGTMDRYIKRTSQILAQNVVNGVSLMDSTTCYNLFLLIGNLIYDIMEGVKLDYVLGLNQCKQIIYCYKGVYRDELADRKKEIRRKWMKERKFATENKLELPPEPSLTNLIEHNEEFLQLKDVFHQLMDSLNHAFILYKELGTAIYKNYTGVMEMLEKIQVLKLQTMALLSEVPSAIEEITTNTQE